MKSYIKTSSALFVDENLKFSWLYFCFALLVFQSIDAQHLQKNVFVHNWFDNITGVESSELHYGQVYLEKHRSKSTQTKFFISPEFRQGVVYFNNQPYFNLNLKYDVYEDNLIVQVKNRLGGKPLILRKEHIDSFVIENHTFKNITPRSAESEVSPGFYEIYRTTPFFSVLKKHHKRLLNNLGNSISYDEFKDLEPGFVLEYKNELFILKKTKDIGLIFPEYSDDLKMVIDQSLKGAKLIDDTSIDTLIDFLHEQLSHTKDEE
ncbi:hypothetical protein [Flagellimonas sp. S3867]|uniref:hypothetical protein n=1 Tax=Flagellimonas sp. S3867 TaxID=2768063 RepID=UPI001688207F|nr:hypothetical protein [Flagellimonas sp. S3867]